MMTSPIEQPFTQCAARQCDNDDVGYFSGKAASRALTIAVANRNTNVRFSNDTKVRQSYGGMHGKLAASPPERGDGLSRLVRRISRRGWSRCGITRKRIDLSTER